MTTEDKKKLLSVLKVLREECNKHENCYKCPLRGNHGCNLSTQRPDKWNLSNANEDIWRAFT